MKKQIVDVESRYLALNSKFHSNAVEKKMQTCFVCSYENVLFPESLTNKSEIFNERKNERKSRRQ